MPAPARSPTDTDRRGCFQQHPSAVPSADDDDILEVVGGYTPVIEIVGGYTPAIEMVGGYGPDES
mgnify:CR=1 FL=1